MSLLEIPTFDDVNDPEMRGKAWEQVDAIDPAAAAHAERDEIEGVLFLEQGQFSDMGISSDVDAKDPSITWVDLHMPHVTALIPPGSPLDILALYSFGQNNTECLPITNALWARCFPPDRPWPALAISVPLRTNEESVEVGEPNIAETMFVPALTIDKELSIAWNNDAAGLPAELRDMQEIASKLARARTQAGAAEVYRNGRLWTYGRGVGMSALRIADLINRELRLTVARSIGRWLNVQHVPGLFFGHEASVPPKTVNLSDLIAGMFERDVDPLPGWQALLRMRGEQVVSARPQHDNFQAPGESVAHLAVNRRLFSHIINVRNTEAAWDDMPPVYSEADIEAFLAATYGLRTRPPKEPGVRGKPYLAMRSAEHFDAETRHFAELSEKEFVALFNYYKNGGLEPDQFLAICRARIAQHKTLPNSVVVDVLLDDRSNFREAHLREALRESMLVFAANNPRSALRSLIDAEDRGILRIRFKKSNPDKTQIIVTFRNYTETQDKFSAEEAAAAVLVRIGDPDQQDPRIYKQHADAELWTLHQG